MQQLNIYPKLTLGEVLGSQIEKHIKNERVHLYRSTRRRRWLASTL